jgi:hypothetical protein
MPSPGGNTIRPDRRRDQARSYSATGVGHRDDPRMRAACGRSNLTPGLGWPRVGRIGPAQSPSCSEATASSQGARDATAHRASVLAAVPDGAATLVVGRGGRIEPGLVACLPDADHNKMRAHGHASDLPERTLRDPLLHLTAPYAIPPLSCGNTLQPGAARGVASWPLPPDTEGAGGSTPPAPTAVALTRPFAHMLVRSWTGSAGEEGPSGQESV